jgi:hypothetical protein
VALTHSHGTDLQPPIIHNQQHSQSLPPLQAMSSSDSNNAAAAANAAGVDDGQASEQTRTEQFMARALTMASRARKNTAAMQVERQKLRADVSDVMQQQQRVTDANEEDSVAEGSSPEDRALELDRWISEHNQATFGDMAPAAAADAGETGMGFVNSAVGLLGSHTNRVMGV